MEKEAFFVAMPLLVGTTASCPCGVCDPSTVIILQSRNALISRDNCKTDVEIGNSVHLAQLGRNALISRDNCKTYTEKVSNDKLIVGSQCPY